MTSGFLAHILDSIAHPIFVKDREFRFVLLNQAFCDLVGRPREAMFGHTDYDFFPTEEADFFRQKDREVFDTGDQIVIDEERATDAAGRTHVLATTKVPLRSPGGEVTHLVGIIHDITRLKSAEEALKQSKNELERRVGERTAALAAAQDELMRKERLAVLGQLAGGLAHQIRNPLGAIKNAAYLLQVALSEPQDQDVSRAIAIIHDEVLRANQIITDLLDYARVRPPVRRSVPVGYLIEQALGGQAIPPRIALVKDLPDLALVSVDPAQVQGALFNLIRNAVEAMPGAGTLTITAREESAHVVVSIADTGPGVTPELQARLFEPLVTTKPLGLGLGLVTARALIENQSGRIDCASAPGEGTRFDVRLPIATTPQ